MAEQKIITVTQLNNYIKAIFDRDIHLVSVSVRGELSNFTDHKTGHLYMTVKDEGSVIRAVMFKGNASKLKFKPENGMKVIVTGRVSAFPRDGQYQIYIEDMQPDGIGALYLAFEQLKEKLSKEGLFDEAKKLPLPKIPLKIGIVTSPTGAAIRDMINILGRRFPKTAIVLYPCLVQGNEAPPQIIKAVNYFSDTKSVDLIIVGRGGGSIEELWAFNDEGVARAVASSKIPVISAVGHETDFTICDFAASLRAPTPSAAAEIAVPSALELAENLQKAKMRIITDIQKLILTYKKHIEQLASRRVLQNPIYIIDDKRMAVDFLLRRITAATAIREKACRERFSKTAAKLDALSPLAVLGRGYSITEKADKIIKSVTEIIKGDEIKIMLSDGNVLAEVTEVIE